MKVYCMFKNTYSGVMIVPGACTVSNCVGATGKAAAMASRMVLDALAMASMACLAMTSGFSAMVLGWSGID